jgi:hypothetical protein
VRAALVWLALALPAGADSGAIDWMHDRLPAFVAHPVPGSLPFPDGQLVVSDGLTLFQTAAITVPAAPARVVVVRPLADPYNSKVVAVFSDAPVVCGTDVGTVGVDSGTIAIMSAAAMPDLRAFFGSFDATGGDAYVNWFAPAFGDAHTIAAITPIPPARTIFVASTAFGDGAFPVVALQDKDGAVVAVYVDFDGIGDTGEWLLPEPCEPVAF